MRDPLTQIRNCQIILQNESFLVFKGKRVFSLSKDSMTLTRYPEIHPYAGKSVFLPDDRLLIQGGSDHCYHMLSLEEGRVQIDFVNGACQTACKYRWDAPLKMCAVYSDGNYALNKDLKAYDLRTGETIDLIGNTQLPFTQRNGFLGYSYDPETQYLLVYDGNQNDIIDCRSRKLIARYDTSGDSYVGCLVDGQFWLGTADGIVKKPFPIFEDIKRA